MPQGAGHPQDAAALVGREGLDLVARDAGGIHQGADVAADPAALHGDFQCAGEHPVGLEHAGRGQTGGEEVDVHPLDVLGLETVEAVVSHLRGQLVVYKLPAPDQGRGAHFLERDRLEPVLEPLPHGGCPLGGPTGALIALAFEVADLGDDIGPSGAGHVPAVAPPVVFEPHRDVAVPAGVVVAVDAALAGAASGAHWFCPFGGSGVAGSPAGDRDALRRWR